MLNQEELNRLEIFTGFLDNSLKELYFYISDIAKLNNKNALICSKKEGIPYYNDSHYLMWDDIYKYTKHVDNIFSECGIAEIDKYVEKNKVPSVIAINLKDWTDGIEKIEKCIKKYDTKFILFGIDEEKCDPLIKLISEIANNNYKKVSVDL